MPNLYLVRHGKASASWAEHRDPPLDELGRSQARDLVDNLLTTLGNKRPLPLISSPLARTRETAIPLSERWGIEPLIEPRVREIPSPTPDLEERTLWLRAAMLKTWDELDETCLDWRTQLLQSLAEIPTDTVIISHFMVINAVVSQALGDNRVVVFRPGNCSITHIETADQAFKVCSLGKEAETRVS